MKSIEYMVLLAKFGSSRRRSTAESWIFASCTRPYRLVDANSGTEEVARVVQDLVTVTEKSMENLGDVRGSVELMTEITEMALENVERFPV